jgi:hypothetical protein
VIAEFTAEDPEATLQVMAAEILRYRHGMARVADAIAWIQAGAPFGRVRFGSRRVSTPSRSRFD